MAALNGLVDNILQYIFFCNRQWKESHAYLEQVESE